MAKIIIIGGGGHAKTVISLIKKIPSLQIVGYLDNEDHGDILSVRFLGDDSHLRTIKSKHKGCQAAIGVGYLAISEKRKEIKEMLEDHGFDLPVIISPTAIINENVSIGKGTVIHDGVFINSDTRIGEGAIINSSCSIDHDCTIGNYAQVAPGAILGGGVKVGDFSIVGLGSNVIQYKTIGERCYIGAGATVIDDCLDPEIYIGTPARKYEKVFKR